MVNKNHGLFKFYKITSKASRFCKCIFNDALKISLN